MIVIVQSLRRRRTDILGVGESTNDVGESTLDVGEQTVGETTRRRNDRKALVHTLVHDKYSPACWVSRKLIPKSKTIPCFTADCFKSSCLQFVDTVSQVNVSA